jgi:putative transposase
MKKTAFTKTRILIILRECENGRSLADVCLENHISRSTLYHWRQKYAGMIGARARNLKELEDENRRLKVMYAELSLDYALVKAIIEKKF